MCKLRPDAENISVGVIYIEAKPKVLRFLTIIKYVHSSDNY